MTRQGTIDTGTSAPTTTFDQDAIESELFASVREMGVTCFLPEPEMDDELDDT